MENLNEKLGQMVIIRMQGKQVTGEVIQMIKEYKVGGIILYSSNYDSIDSMIDLINELKEINKKYNKYPLFICTDQDGGRVNRMPKDFKNIKSSGKLIKNEDVELIERAGEVAGKMLSRVGYNVDFAPVLDIQRFDDAHAIGDRCFGKLKEDVSKFAIPYMKKLKENRVIPVVKHFPGHGATTKDSHLMLPIVSKPLDELERNDMEPFKDAINENVDAIMSSHMIISKIDRLYPTSISRKIIKKYLKQELNYQGLIVTDDLKMKSISMIYGYKRAFIRAIFAQNNMIIIGTNYDNVKQAIKNAKKIILRKEVLQKIVEESASKIIAKKKEYGITDNKVEKLTQEEIDEINKKIEEINSQVIIAK